MKVKTIIIMLLFLSVLSFGGCNFLSGLIPHESKTETTLGNSNAIGEIKQNTAEEVYKIINEKKAYYLIDVRTKEEYLQGHIEGGNLIPVDEIKNRLNEIPEDKPVIVYCKSGTRSMQAANILISNGFIAVYNMTGGIEEWQKDGYTVVKDNSASQNIVSENQGFSTLSVDEVNEIVKNNEDYLIIDARSVDEYKDGHIKGAISIPESDIKKRIEEIPKDRPVIVYCYGSNCNTSAIVANILVKYGFKKVYTIGGTGITEWKEKGYPVETGME